MPKHRSQELPFEVIEGDIGELACTRGPWLAVVSEDDSYLSHRDGSALALWNAAKLPEDLPHCYSPPLPLCAVVVSEAGNLERARIIHAVTLNSDSRERIDTTQFEQLMKGIERAIERLPIEQQPARVLLPLVGSELSEIAHGVVAEQLASLSARLTDKGIVLVIAVREDAKSFLRRMTQAYGVFDIPVSLEEWINREDDDSEWLTNLLQSIRCVLDAIGSRATGSSPKDEGVSTLLRNLQVHGDETARSQVVADSLQLVPELIQFRNMLVHGRALPKPESIVVNMAESALKGLIYCVERGAVAGLTAAKLRLKLRRDQEGGTDFSKQLRRSLSYWLRASRSESDQDASRQLIRFLLVDSPGMPPPGMARWPQTRANRAANLTRLWSIQPMSDALGSQASEWLQAWREISGTRSDDPQQQKKFEDLLLDRLHGLSPRISDDASPSAATEISSKSVRNLAKLLQALPKEELADLLELLHTWGYRGADEKRLIEYCSRENPAEILDDLGRRNLHALVLHRSRSGPDATESVAALRDWLLRDLGFRLPQRVMGIDSTLREVRRRREEIETADLSVISRHVTWSCTRLEGCIRALLRFMCIYLFDKGPENYFKDEVQGAASGNFSKATLGQLLSCLESLAKRIDEAAKSSGEEQSHPLKELQGPLTANRIAPDGVKGIAKLRNWFAHHDRTDDLRRDRAKARELFEQVDILLTHWSSAKPRIYPDIVVIQEIRIDIWNRRTILARNDSGRQETLVTDAQLKPGETFFMYPLSNPLRVDPILIRFEPES